MYTTLFLDVGGVMLTNGWDTQMRVQAAKTFDLNYEEMNGRHALTFDTYEIGKMTLDDYLYRVVFYKPRSFSLGEFKTFMFAQSAPYDDMIALIRDLKSRYGLRTVVVSNEGRELALHRIQHFGIREFIDIFVCSGFIGLRKPDAAIYRMAFDMAQVEPHEVIYVDDRPLLVEIGNELGMRSIVHVDCETTKAVLETHLTQKG